MAKDYTRNRGRVQIQLIAIHIRHLDPPRLGNHGLDGGVFKCPAKLFKPWNELTLLSADPGLSPSRHKSPHLETSRMPHDSPPHTLPYTKGLKRTPERTRPSPIQPHRTRSLTPQVHRTQLCGNHHHTYPKSPSGKTTKNTKKNRILSPQSTPRRHSIASLFSASEQSSSNPVLCFLAFS